MQAFAAVSMLLVGVVTFVVGARLLLVARRTRQILFWGVAGAATLRMTATIAGTLFGLGRHPVESLPSTIAITALSLVASATLWFAFHAGRPAPPRRGGRLIHSPSLRPAPL